jgi:hypothetical protein
MTELDKDEKKLLNDLFNYRKNLREKDWKKSLQKGLEIPEKGLREKLSGKNYNGALESLQEKGLIKVEEEETIVDRAEWSIDYEKEGQTLEKERNIRGSENKKYLKIPENKLEEIIDTLDIEN